MTRLRRRVSHGLRPTSSAEGSECCDGTTCDISIDDVAAGLAGQRIWSEDTGDAGHSAVAATVMGCDIKSNISMNTGERIYHLPSQKFYSQMIITAGKGERWFCSEDEDRAAGWRKAMR